MLRLLLAFAFCQHLCLCNLVLENVQRTVDLTSQLVKVSAKIDAVNDGASQVASFDFSLPPDVAKRLSYAKLSQNGQELEQVEMKKTDKASTIAFRLSKPVTAKGKVSVSLEYVLTHVLTPFPASITQGESQYVSYDGNAHFFTSYAVKSQKTHVRCARGTVKTYTKTQAVQPVAQEAASIHYGPYEDVSPYSQADVKVHFENNSPFLAVSTMTRLIEISQWGNIAVEDTIDIYHHGAKLKGPFSRYEFQRDHRVHTPIIKSFKTVLPASAADVYYRDEIGNISTSHMKEMDDMVELNIRPRFPLVGGWKTHYTIGYNIPSYEHLYKASGNRYALSIRFVDPIFEDFIVDEIVVKVILPERAHSASVAAPFAVQQLPSTKHYTYLDYTGRTVVQVTKRNLSPYHIQDFQVQYSFDTSSMIIEPLIVVAVVFLLFLTVIFYVRLDLAIAHDPGKENRLKISKQIDETRSNHDDRLASYDALIDAIDAARTNKDTAGLTRARKTVEVDLKNQGQKLTDMAALLKSDCPDVTEKLNDILRMDKVAREHLNNWAAAAEKFATGRMQKVQYTDAEKTARTKVEEVRGRMEQIVYAL